jgi:cation diffusion facilitator CzcD-associated flavoprotein CzcO
LSIADSAPLDVLIVGAGLAGIGVARALRKRAPRLKFAILEGRSRIGGTWDLFRYPGLRSDSDLQTLAYADLPVNNGTLTAKGQDILAYITDAARKIGLDKEILFEHRVVSADFDKGAGLWRVNIESAADKSPKSLACRFLYLCCGYYDYSQGYTPDFKGMSDYSGRIVHPQDWPEDFDVAGKTVVVVGSGATAVTLVPALAQKARHVVMLQRSPTYIAALPNADRLARLFARVLPARLAYGMTRWRNILLGIFFYQMSRKKPEWMKKRLLGDVRGRLKLDEEAMRNFTPRYNPWDQRLCLDPDGGFFDCLLQGKASLVAGEIESFAPEGLRLRDGEILRADAVILATGLNLQMFGGARLSVDGVPVESGGLMTYKGCMFEGVPNLVAAFGYANASWTLKCELTTGYFLRLLNEMAAKDAKWAAPVGAPAAAGPVLALSSGYVQRADKQMPRQGARAPWRYNVNYLSDLKILRFGRIDDGALHFEARRT